MRVSLGKVAAALAGAVALMMAPGVSAAQVAPEPVPCFKLPYFGPWGKADFDFTNVTVEQLKKNGIRLEAIEPVRLKRGGAGIYMPIGWKQDHIDPCRGVYYPGGFRLVNDKTGQQISFDKMWLRFDGVYFNVSENGGPVSERLVGTYKLHEFMPTIATPRPLEGGVGPRYWPFYVGPAWADAVKKLSGFEVPIGQPFGNLDAVVKYVP
ncbi:hypothetical protein [Acrocarpospora catenulata]|uniref:hypothetical protein n=1 Tax=Acrocarpospora catenulata TaxID=2836182 RepID=UPI001BD96CBF|nr:hypothetical protein [Acrocarpospora catenulata]